MSQYIYQREGLRWSPPGFHRSLEVRRVQHAAGPAAWLTSPLDLIAGETITPLQRLAALSDLTFGISSRLFARRLPAGATTAPAIPINTDTTIHLERPPKGHWFAFSEAFIADREGIGLSHVTLSDLQGRMGRSAQTLVAKV